MKKPLVEKDVYVAHPRELGQLPLIHAWSIARCERKSCPAIHVFLFGEAGTPLVHFPLDNESAAQFIRDIGLALVSESHSKEIH